MTDEQPNDGLQNLSSLLSTSSAVAYQLMARPGNNLGNTTLIFSVPMADFFRLSIVANDPEAGEVAQRRLDPEHAFALGQFMLKGLVNAAREELVNPSDEILAAFDRVSHRLNPQPYTAMQPVVVNIRTAGRNGSKLQAERYPKLSHEPTLALKVVLGQRDMMYVIDGQHRRMGIEEVLNFLGDLRTTRQYPRAKSSLYPYEGDRTIPADELALWDAVYTVARSVCTVAVEAHLGLNIEQERQLFHDLNNRTKRMEKSLALQFDSSNPVNQFIKEELIDTDKVRVAPGDKIDWDDAHTGYMTRKDLVAVNAHLILNKSNINGATAMDVDERRGTAIRFWEAVTQCDGFGEPNARATTVLAQPVMLKALAKLTFDFAFGRAKQRSTENLNRLLDGLTDFDFSHSNPIWRYYQLNDQERTAAGLTGLSEYLPEQGTGNRDIGAFDPVAGVMRFGAKHNDIFPILGDMIRFRLGLPNRHAD